MSLLWGVLKVYFSTNTCFYVVIGLSKRGASVSLHITPKPKNIVGFLESRYKETKIIRLSFWLRLAILLRLMNHPAHVWTVSLPCFCRSICSWRFLTGFLIRFYSVYLSSSCHKSTRLRKIIRFSFLIKTLTHSELYHLHSYGYQLFSTILVGIIL